MRSVTKVLARVGGIKILEDGFPRPSRAVRLLDGLRTAILPERGAGSADSPSLPRRATICTPRDEVPGQRVSDQLHAGTKMTRGFAERQRRERARLHRVIGVVAQFGRVKPSRRNEREDRTNDLMRRSVAGINLGK